MANEEKHSAEEIADQNLDQASGGEGGQGIANNRNILWGDYVYQEPEAAGDLKSNEDDGSPSRDQR